MSATKRTALAAAIGNRLRARREHLGWTLAEAARAVGCTLGYVSHMELGLNIPSVPILLALAEAYSVTTDWLIKG